MGWKDAWQSVKNTAEQKGFLDPDAGQFLQLPLGAKIGGRIVLQKTPFIRAISNGSFIEMPTDAQNSIKAISCVNLNISGSVYRYYLALADNSAKEIYVQVYVNQFGEIGDIIYCSQLVRIVPETEEEQQLFTGAAGNGLGDINYCLWREQLAELGYGAADLRAAFGDADTIEYWRDAGDPEQEFIEPYKGSETRVDGGQWISETKEQIYYMPYWRQLKEAVAAGPEYLFITTDVTKSQAHVDLMVGIPVAFDDIVIQ